MGTGKYFRETNTCFWTSFHWNRTCVGFWILDFNEKYKIANLFEVSETYCAVPRRIFNTHIFLLITISLQLLTDLLIYSSLPSLKENATFALKCVTLSDPNFYRELGPALQVLFFFKFIYNFQFIQYLAI